MRRADPALRDRGPRRSTLRAHPDAAGGFLRARDGLRSAVPHACSQATLDKIAATLAAEPYDLRVEGHTDNVPIHTTQFASNRELSTARASEMAKLLIVRYGIPPGRLSAEGYARRHPEASNATAEGRGESRRVDIIVLPRISLLPGKKARP
ncbi:MAG TPA: OmpA family protein [Acidobacteriaceae bacterium]|nr:OmpA family protein [Acidobacteriaceae bacterium]